MGLIGSIAVFTSHMFESDCFGFFLAHVTSTLTGVVCTMLVLLEMGMRASEDSGVVQAAWWDLASVPPEHLVMAGQLGGLLFLIGLSLHRLILAFSLHPFAQPLRAPQSAKTLLQRQHSHISFDAEALPKMELLPPPRASAARSGVRQAALASIGQLSRDDLEPEEEEVEMQEEIEIANSESSDGLCAGVLQVLLEASDWPASHCLTPHRVRSGAPLIHWKLVPRSLQDEEGAHVSNEVLRELASSSSATNLQRQDALELIPTIQNSNQEVGSNQQKLQDALSNGAGIQASGSQDVARRVAEQAEQAEPDEDGASSGEVVLTIGDDGRESETKGRCHSAHPRSSTAASGLKGQAAADMV